MAEVSIKSAFVEDNKGFVLKVAEPHSRKNDQGGYDTVSRTFFDVKVSRESGINLEQFVKGSRVAITGQQKTEVREYEGKKYYTLTIWASSINPLSQGAPQQQAYAAPEPVSDAWATAPF
jgi:single-stranded DNA-binding protein